MRIFLNLNFFRAITRVSARTLYSLVITGTYVPGWGEGGYMYVADIVQLFCSVYIVTRVKYMSYVCYYCILYSLHYSYICFTYYLYYPRPLSVLPRNVGYTYHIA